MDLKELCTALSEKKISAVEVTKHYINNSVNAEESIGAYITPCFDSALKKAEQTDKMRMAGERLSPLAGVPYGVKDNISTKGIKTTCASKMLENYVPPFDAEVIARLADCIILGKTNMDEFGMGSGCENSYFGKTRNPRNPEFVPGGSSGGSAAGVAAGEFPFAFGSDTGGSVRLPAAFCGVSAIRPTYGRVSRFGLVSFASSMDQIGIIAPKIYDLAMVLTEISGADEKDSTSAKVGVPDFSDGIKDGIKGMKIAVIKELSEGVSGDSASALQRAAAEFIGCGAVVEEISIKNLEYALAAYYIISSAEVSSNLARFDGVRFGRRCDNFSDLDDMYKKSRSEGFGIEAKRRIMLGTFVLSRGYYDRYYEKAQAVRECISAAFGGAFKKFDCILAPASIGGAYKAGIKYDDPTDIYKEDFLNVPASLAGLPSVVVPVLKNKSGLPLAVQIIGRKFDEKTILRAADTLEGAVNFEQCV